MKDHRMPMRYWLMLPIMGGVLASSATWLLAQGAVAPRQLAYVEETVTSYRPVQQRVIIPVREYRTETRLHGWWNPFREPHLAQHQVPVTRWEERVQTTYAPVIERKYRPVTETSMRTMPPLKLATRPQTLGARQLYDELPMVAVQAPPAGTRTAQAPATTLAPQTFKPAPRSSAGNSRFLTPK